MPKLKKVLITILSIFFFACMFVGFYMFIQYAGRNTKMMLIFIGITLVGVIGIVIEALIIYTRKKRLSKKEDETEPKD